MIQQERPTYYAAVAGDVLGTYLRWKEGQADERQTALTYSGQFFELCRLLSRPGVASFPSVEKRKLVDPAFSVQSRPFSQFGRGIWFYVYQFCRAAWLFTDVVRSRASDVIVMDGVTFFFLLAPLAWSGRRIFLSIHTVLRREGVPQSRLQQMIAGLDAWFIGRYCAGCLVASPRIAAQLAALGCRQSLISFFYPTYDRKAFERFIPPDPGARPFRILYAGRIEVEKGVFDLLQSYRQLVAAGKNVQLDYCGDGQALPALREAVLKAGVSKSVRTLGHLNQSELLDQVAMAQVVVVPTRSSFPEGLNQVVIEAVLAKRPVVTSSVCPAIDLVAPAVLEVEPDKVESYTDALHRLIDDPQLFDQKVQAASRLGAEFFDAENGWTAKALTLIAEKGPKKRDQ
jgi:glycogen(starch) synthase